jgi:hypothetical protein
VIGFLRRWWRAHFGGVTPRERWGYALWGSVALIVAVPELTAAIWERAPWPTISGTIGHLEELWSPTAIFPVAAIVIAAAQAFRYTKAETPAAADTKRSTGGRPTRTSGASATGTWGYVYLGLAVAAVLVPSVLVAVFSRGTTEHTRWVLGYVIYGLIAMFCVIVPSILAYFFAREVPFPTLARTVADLDNRVHAIGLVILAGLTILLIHLALYPWPAVPHHNPTPKSP